MFLLLSLLAAAPSLAGDFSVTGSLVREATLAPGGRTEGTIVVRNDSDTTQHLVVSQRDYSFQADGSNDYAQPGTNARSNTPWVRFTPSQITLEPHESERVHFRVELPAEPSLHGTYWSLLMIEPAAVAPDDAALQGRNVSIRTVVRYAVQIVTHVGGADAGLLAFERGQLAGDADDARLSIDIRNVGEQLLSPRVWVELFDDSGANAGRFEARGRPGLFPGCSARYSVDFGDLTPGAYTALAVADAGASTVFGTEYRLDLR